MKTTIYELLGMIKDGNTPKKIKYDNRVYTFDDTKDNYYENETCSINWDYVVIYCLNEEVEILEEPKGIPEKIRLYYSVSNDIKDEIIFDAFCNIIQNQRTQEDKINEILEYLKSKGGE